jgi:hypothetical protein
MSALPQRTAVPYLSYVGKGGHRMATRPKISGSYPANAALAALAAWQACHLNQARGHVQIPHHWPSVRLLADVTGRDATPAPMHPNYTQRRHARVEPYESPEQIGPD